MLEFERMFLAKSLPDLENCKKKEVIDVYYPKTSEHPVVRLRKNGDTYEITKKSKLESGVFQEQTINLTLEEFNAFAQLDGKKIHKIRYFYPYKGRTLEIGVFQGTLHGLVIVDVEFANKEEAETFTTPDFCLAELKHKEFLAGGLLCGKSYADIEHHLLEHGYKKISSKAF